jgi:hypothetical protein
MPKAHKKIKKKKPRRRGRGKGRGITAAARQKAKGGAFFLAALGLARVLVPLILRLGLRAGLAAGKRLIVHAPKAIQRVAIDTAKQQAIQIALTHGRKLPGSSAAKFAKHHNIRGSSHLENVRLYGNRAARNQRHVTRSVEMLSAAKRKK